MNRSRPKKLGVSSLLVIAFLLGSVLTGTSSVYAASSIQLTTAQAGPGDVVGVSGQGFTPNGSVVVRADFYAGTLIRTRQVVTRADSTGRFHTEFGVPTDTSPHTYAVTARDFRGHSATAQLTILPVVVLQAGKTGSTIVVRAGHDFVVRGTGFLPGESVSISAAFPLYSGATVTLTKHVQANAAGNFSDVSMKVPSGSRQGVVPVNALGQKSNRKASAAVRVVYVPSLSVLTPAPRPNSNLTVHGTGFVPNATVHVSIVVSKNGATIGQTIGTDGAGNFTTSLFLPGSISPGQYTVSAVGSASGARASATFAVTLQPAIISQPGNAYPGGSVTIAGSGFTPNTRITLTALVRLYSGGSRAVVFTAQTSASGGFSVPLAIPADAAGGQAIKVTAQGPHSSASAYIQVLHINPSITISATSVVPGSVITVSGSGYLPGDSVQVSVSLKLINGATRLVSTQAKVGANGRFVASVLIPADSASGTYTLTARSVSSGRSPSSHFSVVKLAPSIVAVPTTAAPGTPVSVSGFGFAPGQVIHISFAGQAAGSTTTNNVGKFVVQIRVPQQVATGTYVIVASSATGRSAKVGLTVQRQVSTHFYFASFYTGAGYREYLAFFNPTATKANVTITYETGTGTVRTKTMTVGSLSRATVDVNADLGYHVTAGAIVSADVPIAVERVVYHNTEFDGGPGATNPSNLWYFANGNTSRNYREYLAILNPNHGPVQVALRFLPTHRRPFTIYRTVPATTRITVNVNQYISKDAVGIVVQSNSLVVVNRTLYAHRGFTTKIGVNAPERTWFFAGGPRRPNGRQWIGAINPGERASYVTVRTYGPGGQATGTVSGWVKRHGRVGYLINKIAHRADASVVVTASSPIVAEQSTYVGSNHNASTDVFGIYAPARNWQFAAVDTLGGRADELTLFNPNAVPVPVVVGFAGTGGKVTERTYVVGPLSQERIDVGSVAPNAQLGLTAVSNYPFVAINRGSYANGLGAMTSAGIHL